MDILKSNRFSKNKKRLNQSSSVLYFEKGYV